MLGFVLGHGQLRLQHVDLDAVLLGDAVAQVERLLELVAGVEIEDVRLAARSSASIARITQPSGPKAVAIVSYGAKSLDGPGDDLLGRGGFERGAGLGQFGQQFGRGFKLERRV